MEKIIDTKTIQRVTQISIWLGVAFLLVTLLNFVVKSYKNSKKGSNRDIKEQDEPSYPIPASVDVSYIDRIAAIGARINKDKAFGSWYSYISDDRCEFIENILSMRNDEVVALKNIALRQHNYSVKSLVQQFFNAGCLYVFELEDGKTKEAITKLG
jgi:hypothetical protein